MQCCVWTTALNHYEPLPCWCLLSCTTAKLKLATRWGSIWKTFLCLQGRRWWSRSLTLLLNNYIWHSVSKTVFWCVSPNVLEWIINWALHCLIPWNIASASSLGSNAFWSDFPHGWSSVSLSTTRWLRFAFCYRITSSFCRLRGFFLVK